ncbi:tetratricopeptide repeat protein [Longimicrobium terrae]|uniref:Tetratricopeptide (TPR) repeat protein n=1 Tax=Longimicrobium terrae TaxID=1639882 RepID=A0A841GNU1_9BACT|nr:tetratricopeptide (TPR) repeat protein [Longimicrobium terrae]NNC30819.1 tetratricopeptide repeat protein [Longimicrobium terrae]
MRLTPPPITRTEDGPEGGEIVRELPDARGVLLWGALRDVLCWAAAPPRTRTGLFAADGSTIRVREIRTHLESSDDLAVPLLTLAMLTEEGDSADTARVVHACRRLARWAEACGAPGTRLAFTQAAALVRPEDASLALETAQLVRDSGDAARAETWFRRTIKLARNRDWANYVWAYIGLAVLYRRLGNLPAAMALAGRALRTATRHALPALEGTALHHLFVISSDAPDTTKLYGYASAALKAYGQDHPRLFALAHDVAVYWTDQGRYAWALPVLEAVVPDASDPSLRALAYASLARAAAGAGAAEVYDRAARHAWGFLDLLPTGAGRGEVLMTLGRAAALAGEIDRAEEALNAALRISAQRGEAQVRMIAERELQTLHDQHREIPVRRVETVSAVQQAERLVVDLTTSLVG